MELIYTLDTRERPDLDVAPVDWLCAAAYHDYAFRREQRMASVYVAGPVMRSFGAAPPPWAAGLYRLVTDSASRLNAGVVLPESSPGLEEMPPEYFYREIEERIQAAQAGITIFAAPDSSAAVESTMLAYSGKPQIVIAERVRDIPRLVRGLPLVSRVIALEETDNVAGAVRDFLEQNLNQYGGTMQAT